jgi:DNA-binding transcriptional MerR regulator
MGMKSDIEKLYYSIGEVADLLQVNVSLIRFWEKEFNMLSPKKNKNGVRLFTKEDIHTLQSIYYLVKEKGYTLEGARKKLKENRIEVDRNAEVVRRLNDVKNTLVEIKNNL